MAKRVNIKIGDVFAVKIDSNNKKFFQLIAFDLTQLNSDVIRAFKESYPINSTPDILEIINGDVEFYAHCVTKLGLKMNTWGKVGNSNNIGKLENILFRGSSDSGSKLGEQIKISERWYIWRINDQNFTKVGKLVGENRKAEIGVIVNPHDIVERMTIGKYSFFYPGFE